MNAADLARSMHAAKSDIDAALIEWRRCIEEDAAADDEMRRAKAKAYIAAREQAPKATVGILEAMVDLETADVQRRARHAEGLKRSAAGAFEAKRQWLSSVQSLASAFRAEAQLAKWEPSEVAS